MLNYIGKTLGCAAEAVIFSIPRSFPMYLKNEYSYEEYLIEGQLCLFAKPAEFNLAKYKKHKAKIEKLTNTRVVLNLDSITNYQRKALLDEKIPFVVKDYQIYLPFLAICLSEKYKNKLSVEKFTPTAQLVFLYLFYNNTEMTETEISKRLNCTVMSASRAYKMLVECGLFDYKYDGRKKYIVTDKSKSELLRAAEPFMIDPVEKTVYFNKDVDLSNHLKSGCYALSEKSMLDFAESDKCYALTKDEYKNISGRIDKEQYHSIGGTKTEVWSYSPIFLTNNNSVDDISLIMSMKNETDERIAVEIDRVRRKYEW